MSWELNTIGQLTEALKEVAEVVKQQQALIFDLKFRLRQIENQLGMNK